MSVYTRPLSDILIRRGLRLSLSLVGVSPTAQCEEPPLTLDMILTELKAERDRLNQAIAALEGTTTAGHRRKEGQTTAKPRRQWMRAATKATE